MDESDSTQPKECVYCSALFTSRVAKARYCSDTCQRKHYRRTKLHGPFTCLHCSSEFFKKNTNRDSFCSGSCRTSSHNMMRGSEEKRIALLALRDDLRESRRRVREESAALIRISAAAKSLYVAAECHACKKTFVRTRRWQAACSHACIKQARLIAKRIARALRRTRAKTGEFDRIDPIKVFERDKWRCHLCGRKTIKALRGTSDDRAPELEHIISLKRGGTHTWGNVACSCRACNRAKGTQSRGQLGLRFAA